MKIQLPDGIFVGVQSHDQIAKQRKVREHLEKLSISALFKNGIPKRRPSSAYIHSTCGCWQCDYCASVIVARALRDVRVSKWDKAQ
ncbi:MAG TPA: hypothetical protein VK961_06910 [Chthoniobacter sp.]|nr:hypothetical protein [Chthoniobacter sp.]